MDVTAAAFKLGLIRGVDEVQGVDQGVGVACLQGSNEVRYITVIRIIHYGVEVFRIGLSTLVLRCYTAFVPLHAEGRSVQLRLYPDIYYYPGSGFGTGHNMRPNNVRLVIIAFFRGSTMSFLDTLL